MTTTAAELADRIGAAVQGDAQTELAGCATLEEAGPRDVTFLANRKYAPQLKTTEAGAVICSAEDADKAVSPAVLVAEDPYYAFRQAMVLLIGFRNRPEPGISDAATVHPEATVSKSSYVGPGCVVEAGAKVGERSVLHANVYVGHDARVGDDCWLFNGVTIYDRCALGDRVTLHAGCSIGQDGFGYATHQGVHHKIPAAGNAVIEDDVEMGAHCSVDRATLGSTVVGAGSKFSNGVTIGHGSRVGEHNLLVAQVGLAGSVRTGSYVVMGGQVGVAGHLKIGDMTQIAAKAGVIHDLEGGGQYGGQPARPFTDTKRQLLALAKLPDIARTVKAIQKRLTRLENKLNG